MSKMVDPAAETGQRAVRELVWLEDEEALAECKAAYQRMRACEGPTFRSDPCLVSTPPLFKGCRTFFFKQKFRIYFQKKKEKKGNPGLSQSIIH